MSKNSEAAGHQGDRRQLGLVVAFLCGVPVAEAAIVAGALLLVTRGVKPQRIYREIDGSLLLMFAGLFVVVAGFERAVVTPQLIDRVTTAIQRTFL